MVNGFRHFIAIKTALLAGCLAMFIFYDAQARDINDGDSESGLTIDGSDPLNINSGGTASDTTIESQGIVNVNDQGTANNTTVNSGGTINVNTGGTADNTQVNGGELTVTGSGSSATNTTITENGSMTVTDQATANTITVNGSGSIDVSEGASVNNSTLTGTSSEEKATITIDGGSANTTTLNGYSDMTVTGGGSAETTTVGNNSSLTVDNGTLTGTTIQSGGTITADTSTATVNDITIQNGGKFNFSTDATVTDIKDGTGGSLGSIENKTAQDITVGDGSSLTVNSGGTANNTTVNSGGTITATESGATVDGATLEEGSHFNFSTDATVSNLSGSDVDYSSISDNTASGFNVGEGSSLTAADGGTITNSVVSGGTVTVESGGMITETSIGDGGTLVATESGATVGDYVNIVSETGGKFDISTDATVNGLQYDNQSINIIDNTVSGLEAIYDGSKLTVNEGGSATGFTVDGGTLVVNGGTVGNSGNEENPEEEPGSGVTVSNGEMQLVGGTAINTTVTGGVVNATGGMLMSTSIEGGSVNLSNGATSETASVESGGTLNVGESGIASNTFVNGGVMNVATNGTASATTVANGGSLSVNGGTANTVAVNEGGTLAASNNSNISDLTAGAGSIINLDQTTNLTGSLTMDGTANVSGSTLDFSNLFGADSTLDFLTITNGVNSAFGGKLVNESGSDKNLSLNSGQYIINNDLGGQDGKIQVDGWNTITILSSSTVRLESDLTLDGSEKNLIIEAGAALDVSGTLDNVIDVTIDGNVVNNSAIDFTLSSGESAADKLTINGNYSSDGGSILLNVDPRNNTSDSLVITGDVIGNTSVFLTSSSAALPNGNILMVDAQNNVSGTAESFSVWRYEGSPYTWDTLFENNKWYAYVTDGDRPGIVPETAAYYGLIDNTFMQTASLGANLRTNIVENEFRKVPCRVSGPYKYSNKICRSDRPVFTGWVAPVYSEATVESPYNYTASVTGFDGGLDLISNGYAKFGLLASYRNGKYTYDKDGDNYTIRGEAETTINSYLGGAYLRLDGGPLSILGAVYAGTLDVDISTKDNVSADTSGTTYGATLDVNYIYENISGFRIEPGVRFSYTSVSLDEIEDNAGKRQEFEDADRKEIEAGVKLAQRWEFPDTKAEIYVKPSVVHMMDSSNEFELVEERFLDTAEDRTLAKIEAGMSFDMINNWSAGLKASYAFGSDYTNTSASLNILYNF